VNDAALHYWVSVAGSLAFGQGAMYIHGVRIRYK
jgi:hypothetical protein